MFYWVVKNSKFPAIKWKFDKVDSTVLLLYQRAMYFLLIYCKLKTNFIAKSQLLYIECPLTRERKQKKNPIFIFKSVRICLQESVCLQECVNTEFDWEVKWGFEKASAS